MGTKKIESKFHVGQVWECRDPAMGMRRIDAIGQERVACSIFAPGTLDHGSKIGTKDLNGLDGNGGETRWDLVRLVHVWTPDRVPSDKHTDKVLKSLYWKKVADLTAVDPSASRDRAHEPRSAFRFRVPYDHFPDLEDWVMDHSTHRDHEAIASGAGKWSHNLQKLR